MSIQSVAHNTFRKVKTITSYTGKARWLAETDEGIAGYIPRPDNIRSPYMYSPTWTVYTWRGQPVIMAETSHKRYEVYVVEGSIYSSEITAEDVALRDGMPARIEGPR